MSTENLLRTQSAERLSESSQSVYLRTNSRLSRQRPQRKEGLDNPGFEGDFLENSRKEHSSSNSVLKESSCVTQGTEGKNIDDAARKQVNSTKRPNDDSFKKNGLQRQRPKTTSGQDLRRKAFINSLKLRRARSASYLVVPDQSYEDVFREHRVLQQSSRNKTNERSMRTPQNSEITKERSLRNLSKSVQNTEKENSHLREYSRRLSAALEERAQLTETLHVLSRSATLITDKGRELPAYPAENRPYSAKATLSAENSPHVQGNSFEELARSPSQKKRRLPETPLSSGRGKRGEQEMKHETNGQSEGRQKLTEMSVSAYCDKTEKERKKLAVAKLAEDLWRSHIQGETFQTNDSSATLVEDSENINSDANAAWRKANKPDVTASLSEANRTKLRRAAFRKQTSVQDDEVTSAFERRPGLKLSWDYPDEKGNSLNPNKRTPTQLGATKGARSNSRREEFDRRASNPPTEGQYDNLLGSQEQDVGRAMPLHQQSRHKPRHPGTTLDRYLLPNSQNSPNQRHQRGGKQKEGQQDNDRDYPEDVDKEGDKSERKLQQRVASQDYNGSSTSLSRSQQKNLSSDSDFMNNNHVSGMRPREGNNRCFRQGNVGQAHSTEKNGTTKAVPTLPSYDIALMTKRPSQGDGHHGNGCYDYKTAELADAFMATEDEEEREELQRQAASEAAVLRREASNLLWKAMDLERICDQNARVRHVFIPH